MDKQPAHSHQGGAEVIIVSFLKVVYPLKYSGSAFLKLFRQWLKSILGLSDSLSSNLWDLLLKGPKGREL